MSLRPRLGPKESRLWEEFLEKYKGDYKNYVYDLRVEPKAMEFTGEGEPILRNWSKLNAPRVDVCACSPDDHPVIFEVKPEADFLAIAQVIAYKELMKAFSRVLDTVLMVIVCRTISDVNEALCKKYGIRIYKLPLNEDPPTLKLPFEDPKDKKQSD